jgi:UDP-N-acetyl-D-mannosaminuronic acid dehydrogenase
MKKICVLGQGYIGLPLSLLLAANGNQVVGIDVNEIIVSKLNNKQIPFEENGLSNLLSKVIESGNYCARSNVESSDVFIIAVPTPLDKETKTADLRYVRKATEMIQPNLQKDNLIILESTVSPGCCEKLIIPILERTGLKVRKDFYVAHCPERAIPGSTLYEMINNDRIVGGTDKKSTDMAISVYSSFVKGKFFWTNLRTAEIVKLMENTFRDINIALANEFAVIAEENGINVWEAIELANKHPRVNILKPGPGVGGHCIAIDPWYLRENASHCQMISLARQINDSMPNHVLRLVRSMIREIDSPVITIFGVAYKGNVDDTRETPALKLIKLAENEGFDFKIYDPIVKNFEYPLSDLEKAVNSSDCIILVSDHDEFKKIKPAKFADLMRNRNVIDTRNILNQKLWEDAGFKFKVIGRS